MQILYRGKSRPKWSTYVIIMKLPKHLNNHQMGENSPNLDTLQETE
jgi:hypothetical protein